MGFNFVVECKRGKENTAADALSRRKDKGDGVGENCAISRPLPNWLEALKEEIKTKPTLHQLVRLAKEGEAVGPWKIQDNVLFFKDKIYLAEDSHLFEDIIPQFHGSTHEGFHKTFHRIRSNFYWKRMRKSIKEFIRICDTCQRHKVEQLAQLASYNHFPYQIVYGNIL